MVCMPVGGDRAAVVPAVGADRQRAPGGSLAGSAPHVDAAQVGLGVLVLAQVLPRQVRERQAVAAACAEAASAWL